MISHSMNRMGFSNIVENKFSSGSSQEKTPPVSNKTDHDYSSPSSTDAVVTMPDPQMGCETPSPPAVLYDEDDIVVQLSMIELETAKKKLEDMEKQSIIYLREREMAIRRKVEEFRSCFEESLSKVEKAHNEEDALREKLFEAKQIQIDKFYEAQKKLKIATAKKNHSHLTGRTSIGGKVAHTPKPNQIKPRALYPDRIDTKLDGQPSQQVPMVRSNNRLRTAIPHGNAIFDEEEEVAPAGVRGTVHHPRDQGNNGEFVGATSTREEPPCTYVVDQAAGTTSSPLAIITTTSHDEQENKENRKKKSKYAVGDIVTYTKNGQTAPIIVLINKIAPHSFPGKFKYFLQPYDIAEKKICGPTLPTARAESRISKY